MDLHRTREKELWAEGKFAVAGVDEAGIGPLAGPVVSAAVILPKTFSFRGIDDSKKLTPARREKLYPIILEEALSASIAVVDIQEIDSINIYHAGLLSMRRAVEGLSMKAEHALVDGREIPDLHCSQTRIVGGDAIEVSIAAASILAKVTRDRIMRELDAEYPHYGFAQHKGYPTQMHQEALAAHGPSPVHRMSFGAVRDFAGELSAVFLSMSESLKEVQGLEGLKAWRDRLSANKEQYTAGELKRLRGLAQRLRLKLNTRE